jgi:hypothetical protein
VERVVEDDDGRTARRRTRDLYGVLVRLGPRVDEERLLLGSCARRELGEQPAGVDVGLVDADHEALVQVLVDLVVDRLDDRREPVTSVLAADPAGEVNVRATVDIRHTCAVGAGYDEPRRRHASADVACAVAQDLVVGEMLRRLHAREYAPSRWSLATRGPTAKPPRIAHPTAVATRGVQARRRAT